MGEASERGARARLVEASGGAQNGLPEPREQARSRQAARSANPILDKLRQRREADRANAASHRRSGSVKHRPAVGRASRPGRVAPASAAANAAAETARAPAPEGPKVAHTPGFAEVAGVEVGTPAHQAGLRRGDRIVEYNGAAIDGRVSLESAWSAAGQPERVPILVEDGRTGALREIVIPSGDPGIVMPPRYEN